MPRWFPLVVLVALVACKPEEDEGPSGETDAEVVDVVSPLGPGEARAGVITDPAALWGGVFSEGRPGDVKIYNAVARFVIQGVRDGNYLLPNGGGVLDADVVRPEGQLGRDLVKDWHGILGIVRVVDPEVVEVVEDGLDGGAAVVRVEGPELAMKFIEGNLEAPGFITPTGARIEHVYRLEPDSPLLEVTTTITATSQPVDVPIGDVLMGSPEAAWRWVEGAGLGNLPPSYRWAAYVGQDHDVTIATFAPDGGTLGGTGFDLLASAADILGGFAGQATIEPGGSFTWTRTWGVGPDLATLTDAWLARNGVDTTTLDGVVTADDGPVAGAWVAVTVDGKPFTVAVTGEDGGFAVQVPAGAAAEALAIGRATGRFLDLPPGAAPVAPYAHEAVAEVQLAGLKDGAEPIPLAEGRGVGTPEQPLRLGVPATLRVRTGDGLPFHVRVRFTASDVAVDPRLVPPRSSGLAAEGWSRDGDLELLVEPGTYDVVVQRGIRYEVHRETVTLEPGAVFDLDAELAKAYDHAGWILGDLHTHAVSSADASIRMEDRVITVAGAGLQLHFGTDHDRLSDYRPIVAALGLSPAMETVVGLEFSPTLRGHFNIYPVVPDPTAPDLGSWRWWAEPLDSTDEMLGFLRERHGDVVIQSNHPTDSGMASNAGWKPGEVRNGFKWSTDLEAVEVLNAGDYEDFVPFWWDLLLRGHLTAPVGVSDSHGHTSGGVGTSATFLGVGVDVPGDVTDDVLRDTMRARRTIATRGPFLSVDPMPGSVVAPGTTLRVEAFAPSWIVVDRLRLFRDGVEVASVDGTSAEWVLDPDVDAAYVVVAEGDTPMLPVTSDTPWAFASAILVDVDGDGWDPPLDPMKVP